MNLHILEGNLVRDPELRTSRTGEPYINFTVAVNDKFNKEVTYFFDCVAFKESAKSLNKYAQKGTTVKLYGEEIQYKYTDKQGNDRKGYQIKCEYLRIVKGFKPEREQIDEPTLAGTRSFENADINSWANNKAQNSLGITDDELPFY